MAVQEKWWIFTFGTGMPNAGHYVKIFGTYDSARQQMIDRFGLAWGFQYSVDEWADWVSRCPVDLLETELK